MKSTKPKYQIKDGDSWEDVKSGTTQGMREGWLMWNHKDGSTGMSRPGTWREKPKKEVGKTV